MYVENEMVERVENKGHIERNLCFFPWAVGRERSADDLGQSALYPQCSATALAWPFFSPPSNTPADALRVPDEIPRSTRLRGGSLCERTGSDRLMRHCMSWARDEVSAEAERNCGSAREYDLRVLTRASQEFMGQDIQSGERRELRRHMELMCQVREQIRWGVNWQDYGRWVCLYIAHGTDPTSFSTCKKSMGEMCRYR